jgi:hypothetical protein
LHWHSARWLLLGEINLGLRLVELIRDRIWPAAMRSSNYEVRALPTPTWPHNRIVDTPMGTSPLPWSCSPTSDQGTGEAHRVSWCASLGVGGANWRANQNAPPSCCVSELYSDGFGAELSTLNKHTYMKGTYVLITPSHESMHERARTALCVCVELYAA